MKKAFENTITFAKKINKFYSLINYMGVFDENGHIILCHAKDPCHCTNEKSFWNKEYQANGKIFKKELNIIH